MRSSSLHNLQSAAQKIDHAVSDIKSHLVANHLQAAAAPPVISNYSGSGPADDPVANLTLSQRL
jgi:hypothetical protein